MKIIDVAQAVYYSEHGRYASRLDDLELVSGKMAEWAMELKADEREWRVSVPSQRTFPGNYLVRRRENSLRIYFNPNARATTNDILLVEF